jgi:small subunit ribosomal protein S16
MVRIRLRRVGGRKQPSYRIVVADQRAPRDGRFIENIGFYNPRTEPETFEIDEGRALHWLNVGAQPSRAVERLLNAQGTLARLERLQDGEPLEDLVAEAQAAATAEAPEEQDAEAEMEEAAAEEAEAEATTEEETTSEASEEESKDAPSPESETQEAENTTAEE